MLAALGQEILVLTHQHSLPVVIGVGDITGDASKVGHELFSNFENGLPSRMQIHLIGLGFVLEGSPDFSHRGNREGTHDLGLEGRYGRRIVLESRTQDEILMLKRVGGPVGVL